uniref:Uncharacterized protein n=1 Tax=Romanomermis culicivorax TaxID=13658 RepID=A0A915KDR5_ROMCU
MIARFGKTLSGQTLSVYLVPISPPYRFIWYQSAQKFGWLSNRFHGCQAKQGLETRRIKDSNGEIKDD